MPFTRIEVSNDILTTHGQAVGKAVQQAMVECFNIDTSDQFQIISGHDSEYMKITPEYKGICHTSPWCFIQITCNKGRGSVVKTNFFQRVSRLISTDTPIKSENVIVNLIEVEPDCWSFGN